ncbi:hypothetical protein Q7P37_007205 [Cladosporium fusiforme]
MDTDSSTSAAPPKDPTTKGSKSTQAQMLPPSLTGLNMIKTEVTECTEAYMNADKHTDSRFELILTSSKGYGLFTTEDIPRGTCILAESPLLTTPFQPGSDALLGMDVAGLVSKLKSLSTKQHENFFALYHNPVVAARTKKRLLRELENNKGNNASYSPQNVRDPNTLVKLSAIYGANMVKLGDGHELGTAVFSLYSRINSSCVPNLQAHYNPTTQKLSVHAVRHIKKGEELSTRYHAKACRTREQRDAVFRARGFECECSVCVGKYAVASDDRREKMLRMDLGLEAFDESVKKRTAFVVPRNAEEALDMAQYLLELFREEGILDSELQSLYRRCSKYSLQCGLYDKAVSYAKKERDIERFCIGSDTAHLEKDMKGAEFWIQHVLHKRVKAKESDKWFEELMVPESASKAKKGGKGGKGKKK